MVLVIAALVMLAIIISPILIAFGLFECFLEDPVPGKRVWVVNED